MALNEHVVLIDIYSRMRDVRDQKWLQYYESPSMLHPNREKGHPIINSLVSTALDYWMQDKQEVLCSSSSSVFIQFQWLNTSEQSDDFFRGTYIADPTIFSDAN